MNTNADYRTRESARAERLRVSQGLRQANQILIADQNQRENRNFYRNVILGSIGILLVGGGLVVGLISALTFSSGLIALLSGLSLTTKATTAVAVVGSCVAVSFFLMKKVRSDAMTANTNLEQSRFAPV